MSYKIALPELSIETNRMGSAKQTCHKELSFASNFYFFLKILFQLKNFLYIVEMMSQLRKCPYIFRNRWSFIFEVAFSLWVSLNYVEDSNIHSRELSCKIRNLICTILF